MAVWWCGFIYIPGIIISFLMPEVDRVQRTPQTEPSLVTG
jgi:hypothetical protein